MKNFTFFVGLTFLFLTTKAQNVGVGQAAPSAKLHVTQTTSAQNALTVEHPGSGIGIYNYYTGSNTSLYNFNAGSSTGGFFYNSGATNSANALFVQHAGLGRSITAFSSNTANTSETIFGQNDGTGRVATLLNNNTATTSETLYGQNNGTGRVVTLLSNNTGATNETFFAQQNGTGRVATFRTNGATNANYTTYTEQVGTAGWGGFFYNSNTAATGISLASENAGLGRAAQFITSNTANTGYTMLAQTSSANTGGVAYFNKNNVANTGFAAIIAENGTNAPGFASGGLYVVHSNAATQAHNLFLWQEGTGRVIESMRKPSTTTEPILLMVDSARGRVMNIENRNSANGEIGLWVSNQGTGTTGINKADATFSGTYAKNGARGVVGTAYTTVTAGVTQLASMTETYPVGVQGVAQGTSGNQGAYGVTGYSIRHNTGTSNSTTYAGGLFGLYESNLNTITSSAIAVRNSNTNYKILGITGSPAVSTSREDHTGKKVILFAPESPIPTYSDYGSGTLVNGRTNIIIDPAFANMIYVNPKDNAPLRVIIQLEGDCNGVYVTNKSASSFDVVELNGGTSNVSFTYQIVANAKDYVDPRTGEKNNLQNVRFPELESKFVEDTYNKKTANTLPVKTSKAQKQEDTDSKSIATEKEEKQKGIQNKVTDKK